MILLLTFMGCHSAIPPPPLPNHFYKYPHEACQKCDFNCPVKKIVQIQCLTNLHNLINYTSKFDNTIQKKNILFIFALKEAITRGCWVNLSPMKNTCMQLLIFVTYIGHK